MVRGVQVLLDLLECQFFHVGSGLPKKELYGIGCWNNECRVIVGDFYLFLVFFITCWGRDYFRTRISFGSLAIYSCCPYM